MNEVKTRNVHAVANGDGTWHVVFTRANGSQLICPSAPEDVMLQAVEAGNRQLDSQPDTDVLPWLLSACCSPMFLAALASMLFFGRGC